MNEIATIQRNTEYLPVTMQSVEAVIERLSLVQELMRRAMVANVDYGQIPGTNSKPTLLKSGAEKICVMFRLCPIYQTAKTWDGKHLTVESTCIICDLEGHHLGQASSMCSTKETKYAYRKQERTCPSCGKATIIKGKAEYGGGWLCFTKKGGCNAKFPDNDNRIAGQSVGRVDNEDIADSYNTVLRIAEKRAYIAAVRLVTGSSALFDEDTPEMERPEEHHTPTPQASPVAPTPVDKAAWFRREIPLCHEGTKDKTPETWLEAVRVALSKADLEESVKRELGVLWYQEAASMATSVTALDKLWETASADKEWSNEQIAQIEDACETRQKQLSTPAYSSPSVAVPDGQEIPF